MKNSVINRKGFMAKGAGLVALCVLASTPACTAAKKEGDFSIIVLPDTQNYVEPHQINHFAPQTEWIKDNVGELNIKYVLHLGDVTEHNTTNEWNVGKSAMGTLDGVVPYAIVLGNHDYGTGDGRVSDRSSLFNDPGYFGPGSPYATQPSVGGFYPGEPGKTENSWHVFEAQKEKFLILALEWGPREFVIEWAEAIVESHPNHHVILITHAYMNNDDTRYDWAAKGAAQAYGPHQTYYGSTRLPGGTNDGEELWQKLVKRHGNFILTINGHVLGDGTGRLASTGDKGNTVHQILNNFQMKEEGGQGYLRIYTFKADKKTVEVKTYSPVLDEFDTSPDQQFTLKLSAAL
ncbi:MAG: metallophosphoesterase [Verrucomicrobiota bacterium]